MRREELRAAIEQPAHKLNVQFQAHLAERLLDDVGSEPGNLPLLEFALTQLWDNQKDGELTHRAYDEIGGVKQALVKHAEQVYSRLSESKQRQAQRIFLALVRLGEATEDTRRVATQEDIGRENWELVTHLAGFEARLVVTGRNDKTSEETVEVVHEALIREWQRLREWIDSNREKLIQHRKIESTATEWRDQGKSKDYLLRGKQLNEAKAFQKEQASLFTLSGLASEFIQKSIKYRRNNLLKLIGFGLIPLVGLTIFLGFFAEREIRTQRLWRTVDAAKGQKNSPARISALQELVKLDVPLDHTPLNETYLSGADLKSANLKSAHLSGAYLLDADLSSADLSDAYLYGVHLEGAVLCGAHLSSAHLSSAVLFGANLSGATFYDANLSGAYFSVAYRDYDLFFCRNSVANLSGADFSGADFSGAHLQEVQYTNKSTSSQTCRRFLVKYPCPTIFPPNFDPKAAGMVLVKL